MLIIFAHVFQLNFGISANIRDIKKAQTALHFAAQSGRSEICRLLLEKGADRTLANKKGQLPFQLAAAYGYVECREVLKHPPTPILHITVRTLS
jgi:ankyrin repeat protein